VTVASIVALVLTLAVLPVARQVCLVADVNRRLRRRV
jgi:hypothetical protein